MAYTQWYDESGRCLGVVLDGGTWIPKNPGLAKWVAFLAWNAQQQPPLDLSDIAPPAPTQAEVNRSAILSFLSTEVDSLRTFRLNAPATLTNAQRDAAIIRLAKDVEYLMRIAIAALDHAD